MLNGARKNLSNLVLNIVTYLWDTTLEVVLKPHFIHSGGLRPNGCVANLFKMYCSSRRWRDYAFSYVTHDASSVLRLVERINL
jgi:hypothetical protein